jgi:hypothetical protein
VAGRDIFLAHVFAQRTKPLSGVDELDLAFALVGLPVAQNPDVSGNAGVVEKIERERDDGFKPIALDDPAADVAFALTGISGEKRGAVVDLGDAAAERRIMLHLIEHVGQEEHLAVAATGDEGILRVIGVLDDKAWISDSSFASHAFEVGLPALAVRRIGEHEVELTTSEGIVGERAVFGSSDDVVGGVTVAFEEHVGFADGVGFVADLLAVKVGGDVFAAFFGDLLQGFFGDRQHAAGAAGAVVE